MKFVFLLNVISAVNCIVLSFMWEKPILWVGAIVNIYCVLYICFIHRMMNKCKKFTKMYNNHYYRG